MTVLNVMTHYLNLKCYFMTSLLINNDTILNFLDNYS